METLVFVVHVEPVLASRIFVHAKRLGMVSQGYAWIVTSKSMNYLHNLKDRSTMQGFIGFRSYNITESKEFGMLQLMNFITQMVNFEIVNVLGIEGERRVGFWTPTGKFTNKLSNGFAHGRHLFSSSTIDEDLETIIWPGGISTIPKGRMMQTSSKILRIGVPLKNGFSQSLKVDHDLQTNFTIVSGFCIDVFRAAMAGLNYQMSYEFIPFEDNSQNSGEANNNLVYEVYLQGSRNLWIFLKPVTPGLWLTIVGVYVLTALVIWLIERPALVEQQTQQSNGQIGRMFAFSLHPCPVTQEVVGYLNFQNSSSTSTWLTSPEEYANALSKGSKMVFPKGSTMARDISREIAKLREDGRLQMLENSWFTIPTTNLDSGDISNTMNPLTGGGFQGLLLINESFQL
ncbi:glutamate receptor 1.2-like [Gossypium australe]|uniref:Glutamate receptor 1.2-like n=1 Tax=Gossypium australe TaxID=47621 RepID=A0A5B6UKI1_9ROSI|nr:glutamate receptor 1.2-like [Gossypium australe]